MITIKKNDLRGNYAVPKDHPVSCGNPAPWLIIELKILDVLYGNFRIYIRGEGSMWFPLDNCYVSDKDDCREFLDVKEREDKLRSLYFAFST